MAKLSPAQTLALDIVENQAITTLDLLDAASMTTAEFRQLFEAGYLTDTGRVSEYRDLDPGEIDDIMWAPNFEQVGGEYRIFKTKGE
ncbi:MAG: hypothetical protein KJ077_10880 [Anaerolineae bacterium]|nr:hypothetical protein [Anaerolineae bacterium]